MVCLKPANDVLVHRARVWLCETAMEGANLVWKASAGFGTVTQRLKPNVVKRLHTGGRQWLETAMLLLWKARDFAVALVWKSRDSQLSAGVRVARACSLCAVRARDSIVREDPTHPCCPG